MKIVISGETFEWDGTRAPLSEALAIEGVYGRRYVEWQADLEAGAAPAFACLAWAVWRRDGRDVPYEDIISGKVDFDLLEMMRSMIEATAEGEPEVPTTGAAAPLTGQAGTATTGSVTSGRSRSASGSARGKRAS